MFRTSAPRSTASSRCSRRRRSCSDDAPAAPGVSTTTAMSGARSTAAAAAARRMARGVAADLVDEDQHALGHRLGDDRRADPLELGVHATRDEAQAELSQGREVRLREEPVQRDRRPLGRIDVAVAHPLAERERAHVHQLDLIRGGEDLVRDALVDRRTGDRGDRVGDRVEVLDVAGADDVDAGVEQDLHVLPALRARRPGRVGVGELVDQGDRRRSSQDGVRVHLLDRRRRDARPDDAGRSRGHPGASRSRAVRAPRRSRPPGPCRVPTADGPPRASGRSCRRRAPCPGRRAGGPARRRSRRRSARASPRPWGVRRRRRVRRRHGSGLPGSAATPPHRPSR